MRILQNAAVIVAWTLVCGCGFSLGDTSIEDFDFTRPRTQGSDDLDAVPSDTPSDAPEDAGSPEPIDAATDAPAPPQPLRAFVSSTLTTGNIGGVAGADAICNAAAQAANLPGTYVAWISTSKVNAIERIEAQGPWHLVNGVELAKTKADLVKGSLAQRFDKDEKGNTPPVEEDRVWTGTGANGTFSGDDCGEWGASGKKGLVGEAEQTGAGWTALVKEACSEVNRVYCLQR